MKKYTRSYFIIYYLLMPAIQAPAQSIMNADRSEQAANLVVHIGNVNSVGTQPIHSATVLVNNQELKPDPSSLIDVVYYATLPEGEHRITARYTAMINWKKLDYAITTPEQTITLLPHQRTVLAINLVKTSSGQLRFKKNIFTVTQQSLIKPVSLAQEIPHQAQNLKPTIRLQINTMPVDAKVIIDDRLYGQAPVIVSIDGTKDHVLQIYKTGYRTTTKLISTKEFTDKEILILVETLEHE